MKQGTITPHPGTRTYLSPPLSSVSGVGEIDLRELARKLLRRKWTILTVTAVVTALTALFVLQLTPRYTATAQVMIEQRQARVVDVEAVLSGLTGERETIESELRVLRSRGLAERVIAKLRLDRNPEFNPAVREPSPLAGLFDLLDFAASAEPVPEERLLDLERSQLVDTFLDSITVEPDGRSRVISLSATSEDPALAGLVANTLAELYLVEQLEAKFEATHLATEWLSGRVEELRERVQASERAVEEFRQSAGLVEGKGVTVAAQQMSELNTQLILARTQRAEAEARLRQVQALLESTGGSESAAEVLSSPLIQRLREQEAEVQRRAAELATEYGPKHPRMINIRAEAADIAAKIDGEVRKIVQSLRNEAGVARAREASLSGSLAALRNDVGQSNSAEVRLRALEREAAADRSLFEAFLARLKETSSQDEIQRPDARIISRADIPVDPAFPRTRLMIAGGATMALFLGLGMALLIEHLDPGFRSAEQVEEALGLSGLGLIPLLGGRRKSNGAPETHVLEKPISPLAEALRTLHTAVLLSNVDRPPKTVLVTSSIPQEGKSTISLAWARLIARSGKRVLLIDGDLRRPRVAEALGAAGGPGIVDVLAETVSWREALQTDRASGLSFLTPGSRTASPPDLFGSEHMRSLLAAVAKEFDLVIIDSPPVMAVSESRILSRLVDTTVFVVAWASTPREVVRLAVRQLRASGGSVAGAVMSMVDVRRHALYGYGDSGYYQTSRYYAGRG